MNTNIWTDFQICISVPFKVGPSPSKKFCFNDSLLKKMKSAFYFILKDLFIIKTFKFGLFWSCRKNDLIRKISLISKFMTSQPG